MKVTIGAHPDLPYPFSNGPEQPAAAVQGLQAAPREATERHEQGLQQQAALMNYWLDRSKLSHSQFCSIAWWALGEKVFIGESDISRLRNGRFVRGAGLKLIDAMASVNGVIYLWQTEGERACWAKYGPHSTWGIEGQWIENAIWLPDDMDDSKPLSLGGFAEVATGRLWLHYLSARLSPADAARGGERLSALLDQLAAERGWGPREAMTQFMAAYPSTNRAVLQRLKGVILGETKLTRAEMEQELHGLSEMIRVVRGLSVGSYGPAELGAELRGHLPNP